MIMKGHPQVQGRRETTPAYFIPKLPEKAIWRLRSRVPIRASKLRFGIAMKVKEIAEPDALGR
jgi:hypothetical protein